MPVHKLSSASSRRNKKKWFPLLFQLFIFVALFSFAYLWTQEITAVGSISSEVTDKNPSRMIRNNLDLRKEIETVSNKVGVNFESPRLNIIQPLEDVSFKKKDKKKKDKKDKKSSGGDCGDNVASNPAMLVVYLVGIIYVAMAIALICDELFLPAISVISDEDHLNLSKDVAGATVIGASLSLPELVASSFGAVTDSEIGVGTIVGASVFNLLFMFSVIAFVAPEPVQLSPWAYSRDTVWYVISFAALSIFVGVVTPNEIDHWQAGVLLGIYVLYVIFMSFNKKLEAMFSTVGPAEEVVKDKHHFSFRIGLANFFMGKCSVYEKAGIRMITHLQGDMKYIFKQIDENEDGSIDIEELDRFFKKIDYPVSNKDLKNILSQVDVNNNGKIDSTEFAKWYLSSEYYLKHNLMQTFYKFDCDGSGTIGEEELTQLLFALGSKNVTVDIVQDWITDMSVESLEGQISYKEFEAWYMQSPYWLSKQKAAEESATELVETISNNLAPQDDLSVSGHTCWGLMFPIILVLSFTVPDVKKIKNHKWCFISFFMSCIWIGLLTFLMLYWVEIIGNTLGIPDFLMGLTLLAFAACFPEIVVATIVAKNGDGVMAVESLLGSNFFCFTVGLGLPCLVNVLMKGKPMEVNIDDFAIVLAILISMISLITALIALSGWKLTKWVGLASFTCFAMYISFFVYDNLPFTSCL